MLPAVEVLSFKVSRRPITAAGVPELERLFKIKELPFAVSRVRLELRGVPTAVVNALRRVLLDEMPGRALQVSSDGLAPLPDADPFVLAEFINRRIALIPLRPQIAADTVAHLRLRLAVTNAGTSVLSVYAGDLEVAAGSMPEPLFNPTFKLCTLQPGKCVVIDDIRIGTGYGRDDSIYNVACRAAYSHLDIPQHGKRATHDAPASWGIPSPDAPGEEAAGEEPSSAADWSGYKVSSLVANPRHHALTAILPATAADSTEEVRAVFLDACANIKERLRLLASVVEQAPDSRVGGLPDAHANVEERLRHLASVAGHAPKGAERANRGIQYTVVTLEAGLSEGLLQAPGETYTVGELLRRAVFELTPDIANVSYVIIDHENRMRFTLRHTENVTAVLLGAIRHSLEVFDAIQDGIRAAR